MLEYPQFFEVNKLNIDQDDFTASSGVGTVENISDYDRTTYWESISSDDATTETITITFKTADDQEENRSIDRAIITGCNAKLFRVYSAYWNGSSYDSWVLRQTVSGNSDENHLLPFTEFSAGRVKIEMDTTIAANEQKIISEFVITKLIWEATMPFDVFDIKNKQKVVIRRLYSGKGQKIHQYDKWGVKIEFRQISKSEMDSIRDLYDNYGTFIIMAEPYNGIGAYDKPEEFYRVFFTTSWDQRYFTKIKTAGYNVRFRLEEV